MKKDIEIRKVENIAIAIVPPAKAAPEGEPTLWDVYVINLEEGPVKNMLVVSNGSLDHDGQKLKTTTLRYFIEEIPPLDLVKIEPIAEDIFHLMNEYWLSFTFEDYLYDKKYIFVPGSISKEYMITIPFIGAKGVMIR